MSGYVFNLRQKRFQDIRVRKALHLVYDWEWLNRNIFEGQFNRQDSYFANSPLAARGLPSPGELAMLAPYRLQLSPAVFGARVELPRTDRPGGLRANMRQALALFAAAGWHYRNGRLRNARGEVFTIEVTGARGNVLLDAYYHNLEKIGVQITRRIADPVADKKRVRDFDFDFTAIALRKARDPGPEIWRNFNSADAAQKGSENLAGVKSPVVDALARRLLDAKTEVEAQDAARALDRVLMHQHYVLPWRYLANNYLIYDKRLKRPTVKPLYFGPYEWLLASWWDGDVGRVASR